MAQAGNKIIDIKRLRFRKHSHKMFRLFLTALLCVCITVLCGLKVYSYHKSIPSQLYFRARQEQEYDFGLPATGRVRMASGGQKSNIPEGAVTIDLSGPIKLLTGDQDSYDMEVRLFGILPIKNVGIHVIEDKRLIPMGIPVGIYMRCKGVLVIGVAEFESLGGETVSPGKNLLSSGDYIYSVGGKEVQNKEDLVNAIKNCNGQSILLDVERDGKSREVILKPEQNSLGEYKAGIWVRDNVQGVGTMTYLESDGGFGALGHGIADVDTGQVMEVKDGFLYMTEIVELRKGENGYPGEMTGRIIYDDQFIMGRIDRNCAQGVFGICSIETLKQPLQEPVPIGLKQEIELGPAEILCTLEDTPQKYQVEITKIHLDQDFINRGIELKVTDPELLRSTGGIIQGMSGSPILQNGKLIGAVTHVLVNAPEKGYGIFIENMLGE